MTGILLLIIFILAAVIHFQRQEIKEIKKWKDYWYEEYKNVMNSILKTKK